jgi:hypothetical protein
VEWEVVVMVRRGWEQGGWLVGEMVEGVMARVIVSGGGVWHFGLEGQLRFVVRFEVVVFVELFGQGVLGRKQWWSSGREGW